jgi:hypothetical protein
MKKFHLVTALWLTTLGGFAADNRSDLIVHEWGTFTSVQGGDGVLLPWQPFITPDLPKFVYEWQRPGFGHQSPGRLLKGGIRSLQRMETPVIYFYSDRELTADVTVNFPAGFITEWYPQAQQIGSRNRPPLAHGPNLMVFNPIFSNSVIAWRGLQILPANSPNLAAQLPTDNSDNHYFAARETDSAFVRVATGGTNGTTPELEKLLFYRGTGNFATPLRVTVTEAGLGSVANTGAQPLTGLFLVEMRHGAGRWTELGELLPGQSKRWRELAAREQLKPVAPETFSQQLGNRLENALVQAGLFPREATAMVKTWRKSWFTEEGVRLLYILPREWTDVTLPLTLNPQPQKLERVMVGRAEIIPPTLQKELAGEIASAKSGDKIAEQRLQDHARKLGRFYGPAHQLASQRLPTTPNQPITLSKFE